MSLSEQSLALVGELRGEFKTWAAYIGTFAVPRASLDARLVSHSDIKDMVLDLLVVLEQNLKWARENQLEKEEQEEGDPDNSLGMPVVKSTIERLFILAVSIRRSARQTDGVRQKTHSSASASSSCFLLLKARYPNARKSLLVQLVQSVYARGASLQYLQAHNRKLAHERATSMKPCESPMESDMENLGDDLTLAERVEKGPDTELQTIPSLFSPTTVIRQLNLALQNAKPSLSLISTGSTVKDMEGDILPYPPIPKLDVSTTHVACTICSEPMDVSTLTEEKWKAHVDADLYPYICISEQCKEPPKFFKQKQDWAEHMQTRHTLGWAQKIHTETWQCDFEHSEPKDFDQKDHYVSHLKNEHEGRFTSSQIQGRARRCKRIATRELFVCPLCDCIPDDIEPIVHEKPYIKLTAHIRRHLKYISFFSLSYLDINFGDGESMVGSSSYGDEKRSSRSSHSLNNLRDVSLSDIPETKVHIYSCKVQDEVFLNSPLDREYSDWSFVPRATLETNRDVLCKGLGSASPIQEPPQDESSAKNLARELSGGRDPDLMSFREPIPPKPFLFIAIDFGAIFSSVTYALSTAPDSIFAISHYPDNYSFPAPKQVPTLFNLKAGTWGWGAKQSTESIKWLKLLLLKESDILDFAVRDWYAEAQQRLQAQKMRPIDVVAKFLNKIWSHTLEQLDTSLSVNSLRLRVAITVPVIWPPYAGVAMKQAAQIAGILDERDAGETSLELVQTSEAAGIFFLQEIYPTKIQSGDSFVVCDAGGSSIDTASYMVESTDPFRVTACTNGDGKFTGAIAIDEEFTRHVCAKTRLRIHDFEPAGFQQFITEWEMAYKRSFSGSADLTKFTMEVPNRTVKALDRARRRMRLLISREEMARFFSESLTSLLDLINQQVRSVQQALGKQPKYIVLVGGLGDSPYIHKHLRATFQEVRVVHSPSRYLNNSLHRIPGLLIVRRDLAVAGGAVARLIRSGIFKHVQGIPGTNPP
ncbi:hypothetical protein CEP54_001049 [Fusarium duplospermum]|uniref:Uncharacterized protein n=1 Tax=Fusarium duplospermum TaxID=1325734 RepID=A0A428R345_9HYPO|nr:hypothetical protein CEP54_001049 [Fusarium duplospermum]